MHADFRTLIDISSQLSSHSHAVTSLFTSTWWCQNSKPINFIECQVMKKDGAQITLCHVYLLTGFCFFSLFSFCCISPYIHACILFFTTTSWWIKISKNYIRTDEVYLFLLDQHEFFDQQTECSAKNKMRRRYGDVWSDVTIQLSMVTSAAAAEWSCKRLWSTQQLLALIHADERRQKK